MKFRSFAIYTVTIFALVFTAILAVAQTVPPETIDGATSLVPQLIEALVQGNYAIAGGIVLMIAMAAVRQYLLPKWALKAEILPIVSAAIGALSLAGLSVTTGVEFGEAIKNGLVISLLAGGTWSLVGKYIARLILGDKYVETT